MLMLKLYNSEQVQAEDRSCLYSVRSTHTNICLDV